MRVRPLSLNKSFSIVREGEIISMCAWMHCFCLYVIKVVLNMHFLGFISCFLSSV